MSSQIVGASGQVCLLLSLHLRRGTLPDEIIGQCGGGGRDMAPTPNVQYDGTVVWNTVVGDAIAQVLWQYSDELLRFGLEDTRWMGNMCENKVH